jgi:hypothetical protein
MFMSYVFHALIAVNFYDGYVQAPFSRVPNVPFHS